MKYVEISLSLVVGFILGMLVFANLSPKQEDEYMCPVVGAIFTKPDTTILYHCSSPLVEGTIVETTTGYWKIVGQCIQNAQ